MPYRIPSADPDPAEHYACGSRQFSLRRIHSLEDKLRKHRFENVFNPVWYVKTFTWPAAFVHKRTLSPATDILHRVHTEWRLPISGVHPIMMEKSALAGESGGCTPTHFQHTTITYEVAVYAPAEGADPLPLFHYFISTL